MATKKPAKHSPKMARTVEELIKLTRKGRTVEELCNLMDLAPKRVYELVKKAQESGKNVDLRGPYVGAKPVDGPAKKAKVELPEGPEQGFMVASDIHVGSQFFLVDQFKDFIHRGYEKGFRRCLVPGDILDGCYKHSRWEETHHGFHAQADYATEVFPKLPGLEYWGITGNHDQTFEDASGISVVHSLPQAFRDKGRNDFHLVGARGGYLHLAPKGTKRGVFVELWHPGKGVAYALSYKLQKHIEGYAVGQKPDFLFTGHWHQQCYFTQRGVHAFSAGTWHGGQSAFGRMLGGSPAIGGWYVNYTQTKDGTLRSVRPEWQAYYERESPRRVELG